MSHLDVKGIPIQFHELPEKKKRRERLHTLESLSECFKNFSLEKYSGLILPELVVLEAVMVDEE